MRWAPVAALCRNDFAILARDRGAAVVLVGIPLVVTGFLKPLYAASGGTESAVTGLAVMFAFFLVSYVGFAFFREHGWGTWDRLRASPARPAEIMAGKLVVPLCMGLAQQLTLFGAGAVLFGLRVRGSPAALAVVAVSLVACLLALGIALVAVCRTVQQLSAFSYLGAILLGGLGGALAPVAMLPPWVQRVAPATPSYWAIRGYRAVLLDGAGVVDVLPSAAVLLAFAAVLGTLGARRFRSDENKTAWA